MIQWSTLTYLHLYVYTDNEFNIVIYNRLTFSLQLATCHSEITQTQITVPGTKLKAFKILYDNFL